MSETKQRVRLSNGNSAWLYTMSNGSQYLVDVRNERIAVYDPIYNRTTSGTRILGKGNLIPTFLG